MATTTTTAIATAAATRSAIDVSTYPYMELTFAEDLFAKCA